MTQNLPNFNLPWNDQDNYWICLSATGPYSLDRIEKEISKSGHHGVYLDNKYYALDASKNWGKTWQSLQDSICQLKDIDTKVAIIASKFTPHPQEIEMSFDTIEKFDSIARNLWLGDAILENRIECHFQPIVDRNGQPYGFESFVRLKMDDGTYMSGGRIIEAAKEMGIHHLLDKHLHILAIKTFAEAKLPGSLFINFITGFIQLPAKYLEGLTEAAKSYGIIPIRIVLDVSETQQVNDIGQIISIINFAHSKGYSVALDDITSIDRMAEILEKARPNYVKLERVISQKSSLPGVAQEIKTLCDILHASGSMVLAEGVENVLTHQALLACGVDLMQGYYYAAPLPVSEIKK